MSRDSTRGGVLAVVIWHVAVNFFPGAPVTEAQAVTTPLAWAPLVSVRPELDVSANDAIVSVPSQATQFHEISTDEPTLMRRG